MACVLNLFVLSLTLLVTITGGSRQFDVLDKKINAIRDMLEVEIGMIKQDLEMAVKNLSMSVFGEVQGKNGNVNTLQIASTMGEDPQNKILAAEDVYKVIQRGFSSEKLALRKSVSMIEQSVGHVQRQLEDVKEDLADIARSVMTKTETLAQLQLINAEISRNKNDIETNVEKAILKSDEDCKTSNIKLNGELISLQTNFMKTVNDIKKDVADINGRVMNKSETLAKFQLLNAEISRNKNDTDAKINKANQDAILKSNEACKISDIRFALSVPYKYNNSVYFRLADKMTFWEGYSRCIQYGAHLPEVTTSGENSFLVNTFGGSEKIYLGATDSTNEGRFVWIPSGRAVVFTDWASGEPNNLNLPDAYRSSGNSGEDCADKTVEME